MEFETYSYIDVLTGFLPQSDHGLLPMHNASLDGAAYDKCYGAFFSTSPDMEPETVAAFRKEVREFGLSDQLVEIMVEASRQEMQLVRFDCDGDMIEGLELIEEQEKI